MIEYLARHAKPISLIVGFLFTLIGFGWSLAVSDKLNEEQRRFSNERADLRRQIDTLNDIAAEYFIANQQGDLIFVLALQGSARQDLASLILQGNLLDRATPIQNMIVALAMANELEYRSTYNQYLSLNERAGSNLSFQNFMALKEAEKTIITRGQQRVPVLLDSLFEIDKALNANAAQQKRSDLLSKIASMLGALILLSVNLIGVTQRRESDE